MDPTEAGALLKKLDRRLERVEQILPSLATKEELRAAVASLATKEELRAAVASLATKEELRAAVAPLATKEELRAAVAPLASKAYVAEEGERTRRHFDVVAERMHDELKLVAEGHAVLHRRVAETERGLRNHDKRLNRLETSPPAARRTRKR